MADPELFVICSNCSSEVSPYVTECPYCGQRLRKRAPDIKSIKKQERRAAERDKKAAARAERPDRFARFRRERKEVPAYLETRRLPVGITALIVASVGLSLAARASGFPLLDFVVVGGLEGQYWQFVTAPLISFGFGFGFVALLGCAIFGTALERRFGAVETVVVAMGCGAAGVGLELLLAPFARVNGMNGVALGLLAAWLVVVLSNEDIRDSDTYGAIAAGALLLALPLATPEASIWAATGGLLAGAGCGAVLARTAD